MSVLKLENVKKCYGVKNNITKAVDGISFQVDEGEFVAIMGASVVDIYNSFSSDMINITH